MSSLALLANAVMPSPRELERWFALPPSGQVAPAVDTVETPDGYRVSAAIPGVRPEDLQVEIDKDTLVIRGEVRREIDADGTTTRRERRYGTFQRRFLLPADVDTDAVDASYTHGVLSVRLGKVAAATPRQIPVRTDAAPSGELTVRDPDAA